MQLNLTLICFVFGGFLPDAAARREQMDTGQCDLPRSQGELNSFLWTIRRDPPAYLFGTIHVPYTRVWDFIPDNSKAAFQASSSVYFELDLTDPYTISGLASCQMLPHGENLQDVLPRELYRRLKRHLDYIKLMLPHWMTPDQRGKGLYADYLFNAIAGNWERKRPVWVMLMVNSLTETDIRSRGVPVLDLYLAQEAERMKKTTGAVERVEEQCHPLNGLNFSQVLFALNQTLLQHESLRAGSLQAPYTTEDLIKHYNCGDLNAVIFNHDTSQVPNFINTTLPPHEQVTAQEIDSYFRQELIYKRNERMGKRVMALLRENADKSFFFAFGAATLFLLQQTSSALPSSHPYSDRRSCGGSCLELILLSDAPFTPADLCRNCTFVSPISQESGELPRPRIIESFKLEKISKMVKSKLKPGVFNNFRKMF
ncbi:metalloprotease TIKI2 isoform X2 [Anas platyrhynchos]|uniref:Metalloprotease TIKI n=1 Tax=Anas platyrhynchos platyrhynchos TaxID=8840 RepID=U3IHL3_ANAPP|nr:metalloprotease TIKI2 isoform X2 [Anas platyrhynchos]|eukprot:XP_027318469.1 metalloprotease TIKI2 isoform X2 [Anas platyrhynchos]